MSKPFPDIDDEIAESVGTNRGSIPGSSTSAGVDEDSDLLALVRKMADDEIDGSDADSLANSASPTQEPVTPPAVGAPSSVLSGKPSSTLCPAGTPKPNIKLAPMIRGDISRKTEEAKLAVSRLFGGSDEGLADDADTLTELLAKDESAPVSDESVTSPPVSDRASSLLMALDRASASVERVYSPLPTLLGWLGLFLLFNAFLVLVLAHLGWI